MPYFCAGTPRTPSGHLCLWRGRLRRLTPCALATPRQANQPACRDFQNGRCFRARCCRVASLSSLTPLFPVEASVSGRARHGSLTAIKAGRQLDPDASLRAPALPADVCTCHGHPAPLPQLPILPRWWRFRSGYSGDARCSRRPFGAPGCSHSRIATTAIPHSARQGLPGQALLSVRRDSHVSMCQGI